MNVERKMESLIFKDARTRIVDLIKEMAEKYGQKIGDETLLKHKLTHQDMANLTATSRQTVTITLNELKDQDQIYMERGKLLIRNLTSPATTAVAPAKSELICRESGLGALSPGWLSGPIGWPSFVPLPPMTAVTTTFPFSQADMLRVLLWPPCARVAPVPFIL